MPKKNGYKTLYKHFPPKKIANKAKEIENTNSTLNFFLKKTNNKSLNVYLFLYLKGADAYIPKTYDMFYGLSPDVYLNTQKKRWYEYDLLLETNEIPNNRYSDFNTFANFWLTSMGRIAYEWIDPLGEENSNPGTLLDRLKDKKSEYTPEQYKKKLAECKQYLYNHNIINCKPKHLRDKNIYLVRYKRKINIWFDGELYSTSLQAYICFLKEFPMAMGYIPYGNTEKINILCKKISICMLKSCRIVEFLYSVQDSYNE